MGRDEKHNNRNNPALLSLDVETSNKPSGLVVNGDRFKRDEWSQGAVSSLLKAYESKWVLRNRAKLKGHDWEDVARQVSARSNSPKSPKTQTQCKNKIESMKKRYRSESSMADASSWPLFQQLDLLLRCRAPPVIPLDMLPPPPPLPPPPSPPPVRISQDLPDIKDNETRAEEESMGGDKVPVEMADSDPVCEGVKKKKMKKRKEKMIITESDEEEDWDVMESVRWLTEVVVKSEQARMETMRELAKIRAETEAKKEEMDLKRTEIIANTQLQVARILVGNVEGIESSLSIGRS